MHSSSLVLLLSDILKCDTNFMIKPDTQWMIWGYNTAVSRHRHYSLLTFCDCPRHVSVCQVLQPVCHTRALQLWTAVYLPTSSPCTAVDDSMELYLPPSVTGDELTSRSLDRCVCLVQIWPAAHYLFLCCPWEEIYMDSNFKTEPHCPLASQTENCVIIVSDQGKQHRVPTQYELEFSHF